MKYDPLKKEAGGIFNRLKITRILFYRILNILLLRSWYIRKELRRWAQTKKNEERDIKILDAGTGFGQYVYFISGLNKNFRVKGIDLDKELISECENFFTKTGRGERVDFEVADLTEFSEERSYKLILCVDVMEHIENDIKVFSNFYKSLVKEGTLLISTPYGDDADIDEKNGSPFVDEHVRHGYTPGSITDKLKKAGFSNIQTEYSYGRSGHIAWKLSMKYPVMLYNKSRWLFLFVPFYYIIVLPFCIALNYADLKKNNSSGRGLIVTARKKTEK